MHITRSLGPRSFFIRYIFCLETMKPLRKVPSQHLFRPFSIPKPHRTSSPSLHSLISNFNLTLDPSPRQTPPEVQNNELINTHLPSSFRTTFSDPIPHKLMQIKPFSNARSDPIPEPHFDNEAINTHLSNSSKQPKPIFKTTFYDPILHKFTQTKPFSNARSEPCTKSCSINEPIRTQLSISSQQPKSVCKSSFHDPLLFKFIQRRSFSSAKPDPFAKPLDLTEPKFSPSSTIPVVSTVSSPFDDPQPIDAGSSIRKPISLWPGMYHSPVTNALWEARSSIFEKFTDVPTDAPSQGELVAKSPSRSRTSIIYKFSSDYILTEQYKNPWNEIRMGKLLEDLDALAGTISFKHCGNDDGMTRPLLLVTASVDKMVLKKPIHVDTDLKIAGAVTWVGRSSMEIQLEVSQCTQESPDPSDSLALTANFTFVARDSKTGKSAPINPISPETEQEKLLWEEAEERNKIRKKKRAEHKRDIENKDVDRLRALLAEGRVFCDLPALADKDSILRRDTCLENSFICQPQQRNIHGRIFGGFLMQKAFELAFATTYAFAGMAPRFVDIDHVDFLKPVDVGNFLRFKSSVLYTELENPAKPLINVEVVAHVTRPELRSSEVSNKFYFTFTVRPEAMKSGLRIRNVVPATEEEARRVLERMDAESS